MGEKTKDPYYKQLYEVESLRPALLGIICLFIDCVGIYLISIIITIVGIPYLLLILSLFSNHSMNISVELIAIYYEYEVK